MKMQHDFEQLATSYARMQKHAVSTERLMDKERIKNEAPVPNGLWARMNQPENFAKGYYTSTTLRPTIDTDNQDVGYRVQTEGFGRKNQTLEATNQYPDVLMEERGDESLADYLQRRSENVEHAARAAQAPQLIGHAVNVASAGGGALLGQRAGGGTKGALLGGALGGLLGIVPNAALHAYGEHRQNRAYLDQLKPEERAILQALKRHDAKILSQDALAAQRVIGTNVY